MISFLFVTDLDNTLVGDDRAMAELNRQLGDHRQQHGTKIVYSTGRSRTSYRRLTSEKSLLEPDYLITAVGTEIYNATSDIPSSDWSKTLSKNWDRDLVVASTSHFADLTPQPETEQRPFKVSYYLTEEAAAAVIPQLETLLRDRGLDVQIIYSGGKDLDVLPRHANKGMAMTFLREHLGIEPTQTVACGDSGNDLSMFENGSERGIIVGNAMPELLDWHYANPNPNRYLAQSHCADGILEGLKYFEFL
ncbi:MAG: sucrose-phosphate phosphatase [Leptolyngbyaceae cyanobacterium RU_5_1]|nr:sucrose-phosphate phosphatase [Leptolyngbyaceae cyanobacterium RU_5_1]